MIERFGWTIVVAVGCVLFRNAAISELAKDWHFHMPLLLETVVPGMLAGLFEVGHRSNGLAHVIVAIGVSGVRLLATLLGIPAL